MRAMDDPPMTIYIATAVGRGSTELGAFDAALVGAGVANFNLIRLSSVIPPHSNIVLVDACPFTGQGGWGDRLYTVYAEQRTSVPGEQVWAGVGWCQDEQTGRGLFVEHEGTREGEVRAKIAASLNDLQSIRGVDFGPAQQVVVGGMCTGTPVCALVVCGYATEPWSRSSGHDSTGAGRRRRPVALDTPHVVPHADRVAVTVNA